VQKSNNYINYFVGGLIWFEFALSVRSNVLIVRSDRDDPQIFRMLKAESPFEILGNVSAMNQGSQYPVGCGARYSHDIRYFICLQGRIVPEQEFENIKSAHKHWDRIESILGYPKHFGLSRSGNAPASNPSKYPPAELEALRLLAPQRAFSQPLKAKARTTAKAPRAKPGNTLGVVKLLPGGAGGSRFD
jgi:hypothetical protein